MPIASTPQGVGQRQRSASAPATDEQRTRLLAFILFAIRHYGHGRGEPLTAVMFSVLLTLLWRGSKLPGTISVPCSYESLATSIGHSRPGRAREHDVPRPSGGLRRAAEELIARRVLERGEFRRQMGDGGQWITAPYRWTVATPVALPGDFTPTWSWPDAAEGIGRIARQRSVYGPTADMLWVRLALVANERGWISMTRPELREHTGVAADAAIRHLARMANADAGIGHLRKTKRGREQVIIARLAMPPLLGDPTEECRAFVSSVTAGRYAAYNAWCERRDHAACESFIAMCDSVVGDDWSRAYAFAAVLDRDEPVGQLPHAAWLAALTDEDVQQMRAIAAEERARPPVPHVEPPF